MARSIYIHLPFCKTKCPYCDFASFADQNPKSQPYIDALCAEIDLRMQDWGEAKQEIETIFFGGGTPSLHSASEFEQVFKKLGEHFKFSASIEVTLEANPGTIDHEKLSQFQNLGINRISIGAQTFDKDLLQKLGRGHSIEDTYRALEDIALLDFPTWSFDLIYGLPGQSLESWHETLKIALDFSPPHISAYALSIEKNTPYGDIYGDSKHPSLPQEDNVVQMYEMANEIFKEANLQRYEISNWAKPGHEAQHNLTYWHADEYYAFGLSAHGYINSQRYANSRELDFYIRNFSQGVLHNERNDHISEDEKIEEEILLKLRLNTGLKLTERLKTKLNQENLQKYLDEAFLEQSKDNIILKDRAMMISNKIIADLIL